MTINLETELKVYNNIIKDQDFSFLKLSQFFKTITTNGFKFVERSKKALEDYYIELKKENSSATHIICLTNFYNGLKKYFDKMVDMFQNIDNQCANKITEFSNSFKNNITESINNLSKIDLKLKEQKINLEKAKNDYFNANKNTTTQELKIIQLKESKNKKEEEYKRNNDLLEKYNETLDIMKSNYLVEINKYNKDAVNYEKTYKKEVDKIHKQHEIKIKFLYEILNNFKKEINSFSESNKEVVNLIEKLNKSTNIARDVNLFKDECNFCNENQSRFILEEFLDYEVFKNSEEKKNIKKEKKNVNTSTNRWGFGKKDGDNKIKDKKVNDLVIRLFNDTDKISDEDTTYLMNFVDKEVNNQFKFIDLLMANYKEKEFVKINSLYNFNLLSSLIQLIIDRNSNNIRNLSEYYFFIIQLAENSIYNDKENISIKNYLCQKIYKLPLFSKKEFWTFLINTKVKSFTEEKTKAEIEKLGKSTRGNLSDKGNSTYNRFKGMFTFSSNENKKVENEIVFGQKYKENLPIYCIEVIEEFIQHFSNFNLLREKAKDILDEMYKTYNFDKIYYEYFITEIKSNSYSSKLQTEIFYEDNNIMKYDKFHFDIRNAENYSKNKRLNALAFSISFLDIDDYKNIMVLNSDYYQILKKVIYKQILLKYPNMNIGKKITIWKIILDFSDFKKSNKYKYKNIKEDIIEKSENNKEARGRDIIDLDVVRTSFSVDKEENQKKISYILKSLVEAVPTLHYNQGMNYIAAFLLNITADEEESFYLFLGLVTSTKYGDLFKDDLAKLKVFFYIFERLISIYLPELYNFFLDNNIKVSYFISSWFITLFTNSFQHNDSQNNPKILLKIWDSFFTSGWKTIFITSISLLKTYESKIMLFPPEELLHFLIGDLIKENYFQNDNFTKYMNSLFNFTIEDELIDNLEKEFVMKRKMKDSGKNLNFQII